MKNVHAFNQKPESPHKHTARHHQHHHSHTATAEKIAYGFLTILIFNSNLTVHIFYWMAFILFVCLIGSVIVIAVIVAYISVIALQTTNRYL